MLRIVYTSRREDDTSGTGLSADFHDIATTAQENNKTLGVTGFLICTPHWYCQVLEGPKKKVNALFRKIGRDKRHFDVEVLEHTPIAHTRFPDWGMDWKHQSIDNRILFLEHELATRDKPTLRDLPNLNLLVERLAGQHLSG
jgi:hypothetical protein